MIRDFINEKQCTLLCSGPMSKNSIDAVAMVSKLYDIPQVLIASRRQIDSAEFGGGYVENYTTQEFANYVKSLGAKKLFTARDHGGPWQSITEKEKNLNIDDSMKSAKLSFEADIEAGIDFLHIDPSIPIGGEELTVETILSRVFELYGHVDEFAKSKGKKIQIELGTEEQSGYGQDLSLFEHFLESMQEFVNKNNLQEPTFVVAQTGTKVMETINVGKFADGNEAEMFGQIEAIKSVLKICDRYGVLLKEHNGDYLPNESLLLRPNIGVHATNVAPEFGVIETRGLLKLLDICKMKSEKETFIEVALNSKKWSKWMLKDDRSELEKAIICGHYIFSNPIVIEMKNKLKRETKKLNIDVDDFLKNLIIVELIRYNRLFKAI